MSLDSRDHPIKESSIPVWFRRVLSLAFLVNVTGGLLFFPLYSQGRRLLGLPITHSFYLYIISIWILLFAGAFFYMLRQDKVNHSVLFLSALGKLSFVALIFIFIVQGQMGILAGLAGLTDLWLAVLFIIFIRREH